MSGWSPKDLYRAGMSRVKGIHELRILTGAYGGKRYALQTLIFPFYLLEVLLGAVFKNAAAHLWAENSGEPFGQMDDEKAATDKLLD